MRGRIQNKATTIWHPIHGHVLWLDTNDAGTEILIRHWCAKHGENLTEWVEYPLPRKKES